MIRRWVSKKVLFLLRAAMACLFASCFRVNEDSATTSSSTSHRPSTSTEVRTKKRSSLSALLLSEEEKRGDSQFEENKSKEAETTAGAEFDVKGLKDEARFLKACGTLPETPAEIRKFSKGWTDQSIGNGESERRKFRSWLTDTSIEKLNLEDQPDPLPTPFKKSYESVEGIVSQEQTPSSCMTEGQNTRSISTSSAEVSGMQNINIPGEVHGTQNYGSVTSLVSTRNLAPSVQGRIKSVHFDCESSLSSISSESLSSKNKNSKDFEAAGNSSVSKRSPYPTPLKLTDEMQTPGTIFPAYLENVADGKRTRIRSQYAYSVRNPVENFSQWNVLKDEVSDSNQPSSQPGKSLQIDVGSSMEKGMRDTSVGTELKLEASLSSWLKPPVTNQEGNNYSTSCENVHCGRTPDDRPILGMVAAHWNDNDESSRISPKWWDGNGIPNSTNKYKEDQKVSWHATPFEERLEKALSEETFISQRKQISGTTPPNDFGQSEESDTALSKFQSSTNFKSIVSC